MTNDVEELKRFAGVHAQAQRISRAQYEKVLARITHDDEGPGSWTEEWSKAARERERHGDPLGASRLYTMARFPYVDGDARQRAWANAVAAFDRWRSEQRADLRSVDVDVHGGRVRCLMTGGSHRDAPFVIVMGGIVSTKEQWAPVLLRLSRFGMAGIVTEMPGTGANTMPYHQGAWRMFPAILDAVGDHAGQGPRYAMAMSFSGHLALRCALEEPRLRGILTVGAPVNSVFADAAWQQQLPHLTSDTLAHLTGVTRADLGDRLRGWALTPEQLAAVEIPVSYVASKRDEIIPAGDIQLLRRNVRDLSLLENDDVHGSPHYNRVIGPWLVRELLRMNHSGGLRRAALSSLIPLLRAAGGLRRKR
ncbi:alpha/beta hydrolase [Actinoallomurus soli]|uniref:alpha/beta hydrolase n=1 Tax=Actinoallomurus soli TaxID=2952535 RepID=UPI002092A114|nr:alpha/beta hydrolase [Actinoallomurus soli]MCO5975059.1 alpha/beta hydrolase [Actinoallomurus soli]